MTRSARRSTNRSDVLTRSARLEVEPSALIEQAGVYADSLFFYAALPWRDFPVDRSVPGFFLMFPDSGSHPAAGNMGAITWSAIEQEFGRYQRYAPMVR